MNIKYYISTSVILGASLTACSSEPRTVPYFEKNIEEARVVVADTEHCLGLDPTKVFTGSDECTNAHLAVKNWEAAKSEEERRKANSDAAKNGGFTPKLRQN